MMRKIGILCIFIFSLFILPTKAALAAPDINIDVKAGFEGKAKYGKGAPLLITITNDGSSFSGDLVIDAPVYYEAGSSMSFPLDIASGETKTIHTSLPAINDMGFSQGNQSIFLYENGWKNGKLLTHRGAQHITVGFMDDNSHFIIPFTTNIDRLAALKNAQVANENGQHYIFSNGETDNLPADKTGWEMIDTVVVDKYPIADIPDKVQTALVDWMQSGGVIIFGASGDIEAESGLFQHYLPLRLNEKTVITHEDLNRWTEDTQFSEPVTAYQAVLQKDAQWLANPSDAKIAAFRKVGKGGIIQTTFPLGDEPHASLDDMSRIWEQLLSAGEQFKPVQWHHETPLESLAHTMGEPNKLFETFKVSAWLMFGIIILYIIIIIPVLYFIVKKKDKREAAWWIIPSIALITSIGIFTYGAKDRISHIQIQQSAALQLGEDGKLTGYYTESLLSNKSGDFSFTAPAGTTQNAEIARGIFGPSVLSLHKQAITEKDATGSTLHLRDIGYWSIASFLGETELEEQGSFTHELTVENNMLTGSVTNEFTFPVADVSIWTGTSFLAVGDLGPGETAEVKQTLKTATLIPYKSVYNPYIYTPVANRDDVIQMRKDGILSFAGEYMELPKKPMITAYANASMIPVQSDTKKPVVSAINLLLQPVTAETKLTDAFTVVPEMMAMRFISEATQMEGNAYVPDQYYFDEPSFLQIWQLPEEVMNRKISWKQLKLSKIQQQIYKASLLNVKTGEYENTDGELIITDRIEDYMTDTGKVTVRLQTINPDNAGEARIPVLTLEGEVKK